MVEQRADELYTKKRFYMKRIIFSLAGLVALAASVSASSFTMNSDVSKTSFNYENDGKFRSIVYFNNAGFADSAAEALCEGEVKEKLVTYKCNIVFLSKDAFTTQAQVSIESFSNKPFSFMHSYSTITGYEIFWYDTSRKVLNKNGEITTIQVSN